MNAPIETPDFRRRVDRYKAALRHRGCNDEGQPLCQDCMYAIVDEGVLRCSTCAPANLDAERLAVAEIAAKEYLAERAAATKGYALHCVGGEWTDDAAAFRKACRSARMRQVAERWTLADGGLLLSADTGRGKTIAVQRALRRNIIAATTPGEVLRVRWTTAADLALARKRHELGAGEAPAIVDAVKVQLLVIDELGFEVRDEAIFEVLDQRYAGGLRTLVTTGRRVADLRDRYGAALVRRIHEPVGRIVEDWSGT